MALTKLNNSSLAAVTAAGIPIRSGSVLQTLSTTKTDSFSFAASGMQNGIDIPGLTLAITPAATSSKILVIVQCAIMGSNAGQGIKLVRGSTEIALGDASGSNKPRSSTIGFYAGSGTNGVYGNGANHLNFLDSPNTTSATTYKIQGAGYNGTFYVNRTIYDTDNFNAGRCISTLTLMEIAG
jgi:hypothetical protein